MVANLHLLKRTEHIISERELKSDTPSVVTLPGCCMPIVRFLTGAWVSGHLCSGFTLLLAPAGALISVILGPFSDCSEIFAMSSRYPGRYSKIGFRILAYILVVLAVAGVFLPLLPTTPFVLLAAFFASKGSPVFARWLENHPKFGPIIVQWRASQAVPASAKVLACTMMTLSWAWLFWSGAKPLVLVMVAITLVAVACYLLTRPTY